MSKRVVEMNRRRDRILDAARDLISDEGYENLTMRSLAQASGVTVPTIYNLVGNKDAVLGAAIQDGTVRFWQNAQGSNDPIAILERIVAELLCQPEYYRPVLRLLFKGVASKPMAELDALFLQHLHDSLKAMAERGELEAWADCAVLAERLLSNLYGATSEWVTGRLSDTALPVAATYDATISLAGVATEKTRRSLQSRARRVQKSSIQSERGRKRARKRKSSAARG